MDRLLIADDDNIDRKLLETYLRQSGYDIISTTNGREAWDILSSPDNPPQIAIVDWMMPEMDGITLCRKIRELDGPQYIYTILVTGKSMSADMVEGLEAGADDYLTKPYEKAILLARINVGARIIRLEREKNEQLKKIQTTNRKLQQNMESAVQIQLSLLPPKSYRIGDFQFDWFFKPSEMLGGDMLHVYKLSETKAACYVLDVSGHGTQAALLSVTIRNQLTLNASDLPTAQNYGGLISLASSDHNPLAIIEELANHYTDLLEKTGHFFTIVYGVLDITTGTFDYVSAGHYSPILVARDNSTVVHDSGGAPIGMFRGLVYEQQRLQLQQGDRLYLFSDGLVEQADSSGEQFGVDRLIQSLKTESADKDRFGTLINTLESWANTSLFNDDIALVEIAHKTNQG